MRAGRATFTGLAAASASAAQHVRLFAEARPSGDRAAGPRRARFAAAEGGDGARGRFKQVVRRRDGALTASVEVLLLSAENSVISESLHAFQPDGVCDPAADRLAVLWPSEHLAASGTVVFDPTVYIVATASGGPQWTGLPALSATLRRAACPVGWSYVADARACVQCFPTQYGAHALPRASVVTGARLRLGAAGSGDRQPQSSLRRLS